MDRADTTGAADRPVLYLLFAQGTRPGIDEVQSRLAARPDLATEGIHDGAVELVLNGLTFDLSYAGDADETHLPEWRSILAFEACAPASDYELISLQPGAHLAGGEALLPIVRGWLRCGQIIGETLEGCEAFVWSPASLAVGADVFCDSIRNWTARNTFPTLATIALDLSFGGAIQSRGLAFFTGQEMRLEAPDMPDAQRIAVIIAGHLALSGRLEEVSDVTAHDGGLLRLTPSANGRLVRVTRA